MGQVQENSPAQQAGLEPYFDFIITIGHSRLVSFAVSVCCVGPKGSPCPAPTFLFFWREALPSAQLD